MNLSNVWKQSFGDKYITLLDQALLSFINFGSILILSKLTKIHVFGDFVVTYSYSVFLTLFTSLLLSSPILVFFAKKWQKIGNAYLFGITSLTFLINLAISSLLYFFLQLQIESVTFWPFFLSCFGISIFDVLKKFTFALKGNLLRKALLSTVFLNLIFFGLLYWCRGNLQLNTILLIYCLSFLSASFFLLFFILKNEYFRIRPETIFHFKLYKKIFKTHYQYSKWLLMGGVAFWGYSQGIYILAKYYAMNDMTIGLVRTMQNLLGIFSVLMIAMESHFTSLFARNAFNLNLLHNQIKTVYKENYLKVSILFLGAVPIGLTVYNLVYGDKYGTAYSVFFGFFFVQFILVAIKPVAIALKSLEKTKVFFAAHILAVIVVIAGISLLSLFKIKGALITSYTIANVIYVFCIFKYYSKHRNRTINVKSAKN